MINDRPTGAYGLACFGLACLVDRPRLIGRPINSYLLKNVFYIKIIAYIKNINTFFSIY